MADEPVVIEPVSNPNPSYQGKIQGISPRIGNQLDFELNSSGKFKPLWANSLRKLAGNLSALNRDRFQTNRVVKSKISKRSFLARLF
jgi:hypothetical protein